MRVKELKKLARHPVRYFFEEGHGIDFEWKEQETEFALTPLEMGRVRKSCLSKSPLEVIDAMKKEGKFPTGNFGKAAVLKIEEEIYEYREALGKLGVKPEEIHDDLCPLCPQGMLFHGDDTLEDLLKIWPLYLLVNTQFQCPLLLTKKGKVSKLHVDDPKGALERYLDYAERAKKEPSPLMPKWASKLLKEGEIPELLEEDEIITWAKRRDLLPKSDAWANNWLSYLKEVFRELV